MHGRCVRLEPRRRHKAPNLLWTSSVRTPGDFGIALVGFVLLTVWRAPPLAVVVISALGGIALAQTVSLRG